MRKLIRENAIPAIEQVIAQQDNDLLQRLYQDALVHLVLDQITVLRLWNGLAKLDDLSDEALLALVDFLHCPDGGPMFDVVDYSYLYPEYLGTIENPSTRRQTEYRLGPMIKSAMSLLQKDLPEISRPEALMLRDAMLDDASPTTVYRRMSSASVFCDWCIKHDKYPQAINGFRKIPKASMEPWVQRHLVKDEYDLAYKLWEEKQWSRGSTGPVILALAWLGFSQQEMLDLRDDDVDLLYGRVRGVQIPRPLTKIFLFYLHQDQIPPEDRTGIGWKQENLGRLLKRLVPADRYNGRPFDVVAIKNSIAASSYTIEGIVLSRRLYDAYQQEQQQGSELAAAELASILQVSGNAVRTHYLEVYRTYKALYWEHA